MKTRHWITGLCMKIALASVFCLFLPLALAGLTKAEEAANIAAHGKVKTVIRTVDGTEHVLTTTHEDDFVVEERWPFNQGEIDKVAADMTVQAYIDNATPTAAENAVAIKLLIERGWRMGP